MSANKKDCLQWLLRNYGKAIDTEEYKEYETECATKENIKDIENLHLYFNDSNLIRGIYKQMSKDYGFCFLKEIEVSGSSDNIQLKIYSSKTNKLNNFKKQLYIESEIVPCPNATFAIPFSVPQHANMLIINREKKTVEHFEPNGILEGAIGEILNLAAEKLIKELFPTYRYIPVISFCPKTGIQTELARRFPDSKFTGSCAIWSMWYAFLRLSSPELDQQAIYDYSLQTEDLEHLNHFVIYLINAFLSKVHISRNEEGQPTSVDGKKMKVFKRIDFENGDVYQGQTISVDNSEGKTILIPFGIGKLFIPTLNEIYQGTFVMGDIIEGSRLDLNTDETYEGTFVEGQPSGQGISRDKNGTILFEGNWNKDQPEPSRLTKRPKTKGGVSTKPLPIRFNRTKKININKTKNRRLKY